MKLRYLLGAAAFAFAPLMPAAAQDAPQAEIVAPEIEFEEWTLDNGLRVIALQDQTTANVYTSMWYDVGAKHDPEGRAGFAHLFEHILSRKTENMPYNLIYGLTADVGGTRNASTSPDRTNYFEIVPAEYLETMLWTHRERMALPVIDEQVFESERGVVKEEFRQRVASQPYGPLFRLVMPENAYDILPNRRPSIGDIEQLDSAQLADALAFHEAYYGPDTATLIVAGNFEQDNLRALVDRYFADIPARANPVSLEIDTPVPMREGARLVEATYPNVPLPIVGSVWKLPAADHPDMPALLLLEEILSGGANSRLQDALIRSGKAVDKALFASPSEEAGYFGAFAFVSPTGDRQEVEGILAAEMERARTTQVTAAELNEARNAYFSSALSRRQTATGRAQELGEALVQTGNPRAADALLAAMREVSAADILRAAQTWLKADSRVDIRYSAGEEDPSKYRNPVPMPTFRTLPPVTSEPRTVLPEGQRMEPPAPGQKPEVAAPEIVETQFANGVKVIAAQTGDTPIATITAVLPGGVITERRENAGVSEFAATLAEQGTSTRTEEEIAATFESLGANFSASPSTEGTLVSVTAPVATLEAAGRLMVEIIRDASYPEDKLELERNRALEGIKIALNDPGQLASLASTAILYGDAPYGITSTPETIARVTAEDLRTYRRTWWQPQATTLIVSGGIDTGRAVELTQDLFGDWQSTGELPELPENRAGEERAPRTVVIDLPDAGQAAVYAAVRTLDRQDNDYYALQVANAILGGGSSGRLFEEIRTNRSLSYGAYSGFGSRTDDAFLTASSQTKNETADEVAQIILQQFDRLGTEPLDADLIEKRTRYLTGSYSRSLETSGGFNSIVGALTLNGLSPQEAVDYAEKLGTVTPESASAAAQRYVGASDATVIIVGDSQYFLDDLRTFRPDVEVIPAAELDLATGRARAATGD
ncbi:pitrilysin family protein [Qipengyuania sp. JC766]|uniref:M16 family metallopeptidase n=1 Tax=Qipengyuania sp. JC766 TaxID=3232139 RepID=UPI003458C1C4